METLLVLGSIASYFLVGMVAGRTTFVVSMKDAHRWEHDVTKHHELARCCRDSDSDHDPATMGCNHKTKAYDNALWGLWLMVFIWPLVTVLFIIFGGGEKLFKLLTRETKPERQRRLKREARERKLEMEKEDERTRRLAKQLDLQMPNEITSCVTDPAVLLERKLDRPGGAT